MVLVEFKKTFPPRAVEWLMGFLLASWGVSVILQPTLFAENRAWSYMATMAPQEVWGLSALGVGMLRLLALFINGSWFRTPQLRIATAFMCCFVWTQVFLGLVHASGPTTLYALVPWFILADIYSTFRAGTDAAQAMLFKQAKDLNEERERTSSNLAVVK